MIRTAHLVLAVAFTIGVVIQVFLAGLGVFDDPSTFGVHATWGYMLEVVVLALLVLAIIGRLGRRQIAYAAALIGMFALQSIFVAVRDEVPVIAALHPVNGFAILLVGILQTRDAWGARATARAQRASAAYAPALE
ncbi:MAG: DUF6220 domain-containing protein [Chloroflexota bacterium]